MKLKLNIYNYRKKIIHLMKYLKKFESFDQSLNLGRFSEEEEELNMNPNMMEEEEEECATCSDDEDEDDNYDEYTFSSELENDDDNDDEDDEDVQAHRIRRWGDEVVEKKKVNAGLQAYLDKKVGKKEDKKEDKKETGKSTEKETTYGKSELKNPEKADLNKNKKISGYEKARGKAIQNAVQDEKEEKSGKGLTAAQKKLPAGLQKAIAAKKK